MDYYFSNTDKDAELAKRLQEEEEKLYQQQVRMKSLINADQALARQLQKEFDEQIINNDKDRFQPTEPTTSSTTTTTTYKEIVILDDNNKDSIPSISNNNNKDEKINQHIISMNEINEKEFDTDYLFALKVQDEENNKHIGKGKRKENENAVISSSSSAPVVMDAAINDEYDPNPDIIELFLAFNGMYFDGKLAMVEVKWSKRMTLCAGICKYEIGGFCSISLSEPLLKFRPRSDMVNTLLHEMIHAYLFVTMKFNNRESHGPEFLNEAKRINNRAGTNITVYHTFNDEVKYYKTHVWKCDGLCQERPPYYGIVRRSMNRPPQKADSWFATHQQTCGGQFKKIQSPPEKPKITYSKKDKNKMKDKNLEEQPNKMTKYLIIDDDDDDIFNNLETLSPKKKKRME